MHFTHVAGVDEAGRGPLAGPVIAAAVILDPNKPAIEGLTDSKKLSASRREALCEVIKAEAVCWAIGRADVDEIDQLNILHASMLAMQRAVADLAPTPQRVEVDGNRCPDLNMPVEAIVKGDSKVAAISAASVLAKVARDQEMLLMHTNYPEYEFDRHKGYPTARHYELLQVHGPCPEHRRSFAPVAAVLAGEVLVRPGNKGNKGKRTVASAV